jgi:hypothetical protein
METWRVVLVVGLLVALAAVTWRRQLAERRLARWRDEERQARERHSAVAQLRRDLEELQQTPRASGDVEWSKLPVPRSFTPKDRS